MKKNEYMKPSVYVARLRYNSTLLVGSMQQVVAKEGATNIELTYSKEQPEEGNMWNNGW